MSILGSGLSVVGFGLPPEATSIPLTVTVKTEKR